MAIRTRAELATDIAGLLADNSNGEITAQDLRTVSTNIVDSMAEDASLVAVAKSGAYGDLTGTPAIPAAPGDIGAATAAQGGLADTALQPADIAQVISGSGVTDIVALTQAAFDALPGPSATTLYVITG